MAMASRRRRREARARRLAWILGVRAAAPLFISEAAAVVAARRARAQFGGLQKLPDLTR